MIVGQHVETGRFPVQIWARGPLPFLPKFYKFLSLYSLIVGVEMSNSEEIYGEVDDTTTQYCSFGEDLGEETITALKKVKKIFDPNNILNPGVLCFDD